MVSFPHRDSVMRYIAKGKEEGARVLCGGDVLKGEGFDNGAWVAPTVFTDCTDEMTIVREEIFGPVMSILTYESMKKRFAAPTTPTTGWRQASSRPT
jgi:acyl-CoA reductase-like NAD-dependent aldehyde dehydrogenase